MSYRTDPPSRLTDICTTIVITALVLYFAYQLIRPYAIWLVLALIIVLISRLLLRSRRW